MAWSTAGVALIGIILAGCTSLSFLPGAVEEPCRAHANPTDCQAALDAARPDLNADPELYDISVGAITCTAEGCTTWVSSAPRADVADCLPLGEIEMFRGPGGEWSVLSLSHGDPPCAFEG